MEIYALLDTTSLRCTVNMTFSTDKFYSEVFLSQHTAMM